MRRGKFALHTTCLLTLAAGLAIATSATAQNPSEEITVKAERSEIIGQSSTGVPIREVRLEGRVSYADLDLTSAYGAHVLEQRIKETAAATCKKLKVELPAQGSTEETCIKGAVDGAMVQAKKVIDAKRAK